MKHLENCDQFDCSNWKMHNALSSFATTRMHPQYKVDSVAAATASRFAVITDHFSGPDAAVGLHCVCPLVTPELIYL